MSIVSTMLFLIVIWMGVDSMLHSDRSELVARRPGRPGGRLGMVPRQEKAAYAVANTFDALRALCRRRHPRRVARYS